MKFAILCLAIATLIGCNCGGRPTVDCSTPAKCKSPECVNAGCNFSDAGQPLTPKTLGAPKPKTKPLKLQVVKVGERRMATLDASTELLSKQCSDDALGAGFYANLSTERMVRASVNTSNQVSFSAFKVDRLGKRQLVKCVRGFSPDLGIMKLGVGRWEFLITGQGSGEFLLQSQSTGNALRLLAAEPSAPSVIQAGDQWSLMFNAGAGQGNPLACGREGTSYRVRIRVNAPLRFSLSLAEFTDDIQFGLRSVGAQERTFCAPAMNPKLVRTLESGLYELIVESKLSMLRLNQIRWALSLEYP
jgi:hypothetical protein